MILLSYFAYAQCEGAINYINRSFDDVSGLDIGDLNNDGFNDIAISTNVEDNFIAYFNNGFGSFPESNFIFQGVSPRVVSIGELTGDSYNDIVGTDITLGNAYLFTSNGDGTFIVSIIGGGMTSPQGNAIGDYNGDGLNDVSISASGDDQVRIFKNDGNRNFTLIQTIPHVIAGSLKSIDIDSDGDIDILECNLQASLPYLTWFRNDGSGIFSAVAVSGASHSWSCDAGDIDGDGDIDLIGAGEGFVQWFRNNGYESFTVINISIVKAPQDMELGDLNQDGQLDFVIGDTTDDVITYYEQNNLNFVGVNLTDTALFNPSYIRLGLLNIDDKLDIAFGDSQFDDLGYINNNKCQELQGTIIDCGLDHVIFCDHFNYALPLTLNYWNTEIDGVYDGSFAPTNDTLYLTPDNRISEKRTLPETRVNYTSKRRYNVIISGSYPIVTSTFNITLVSNLSVLTYKLQDYSLANSVNLKFSNLSLSYYNRTGGGYSSIYSDFTAGTEYEIRITQLLGNDTASIKDLAFNVTQEYSHYLIWVNNTLIADNLLYDSVLADDLRNLNILKEGDSVYLDDIYIFRGTSREINNENTYLIQLFTGEDFELVVVLDSGEFCNSDAECQTGLCEYHYCTLQKERGICTFDEQCLSGECSKNVCTKAGIWDSIEASKTQQYGNDDKSNNFVSLVFMLGIPMVILIGGGASLVAVILSLGAFIVLGFFFALVGWLSPFILLGIIILVLFALVLLFLLKGGSD